MTLFEFIGVFLASSLLSAANMHNRARGLHDQRVNILLFGVLVAGIFFVGWWALPVFIVGGMFGGFVGMKT